RFQEAKMVKELERPSIVGQHFRNSMYTMALDWKDEYATRKWRLPDGVCLLGPAPRRLGFRIRPKNSETYAIRLLWNETYLTWPGLRREELLDTDFELLFAAVGIDLWYLLDHADSQDSSEPIQAA